MTPVLPALAMAFLCIAVALPAHGAARDSRAATSASSADGAARALAVLEAFRSDLEAALAVDAGLRGAEARRAARAARAALVATPFSGPAVADVQGMSDIRGTGRGREAAGGVSIPVHLPAGRAALSRLVEADTLAAGAVLPLRRLEVAGTLREAWWTQAGAAAEADVLRRRLVAAEGVDRSLRALLARGEISEAESLLGRAEVLSAQARLADARSRAERARTAYAALTGGATAALPAPGTVGQAPERPRPAEGGHPALAAAEAESAAARSEVAWVAATPRENPEVGGFARHQSGSLNGDATMGGVALRIPLASETRNAPRRADAQARLTAAEARRAEVSRVLAGDERIAAEAERAAREAVRLTSARLEVAGRQLAAADIAFQAREIGTFDLFRIRAAQAEAAETAAAARVELGRAAARLNQARGLMP